MWIQWSMRRSGAQGQRHGMWSSLHPASPLAAEGRARGTHLAERNRVWVPRSSLLGVEVQKGEIHLTPELGGRDVTSIEGGLGIGVGLGEETRPVHP